MDREEFEAYLDRVNREAEPFIPLKNCAVCGKPITDTFAVDTAPRWRHRECLESQAAEIERLQACRYHEMRAKQEAREIACALFADLGKVDYEGKFTEWCLKNIPWLVDKT